MTTTLIANLFQGLYFLSVVMMFLASTDKVKSCGIPASSNTQLGLCFGSAVAVITFMCVQVGIIFGLVQAGEYLTCPVSVFVISVGYNLDEYAGVDVLRFFRHHKKEDSIF